MPCLTVTFGYSVIFSVLRVLKYTLTCKSPSLTNAASSGVAFSGTLASPARNLARARSRYLMAGHSKLEISLS